MAIELGFDSPGYLALTTKNPAVALHNSLPLPSLASALPLA